LPTEYNTLDDKYARVVADELMPVLNKEYNIAKESASGAASAAPVRAASRPSP